MPENKLIALMQDIELKWDYQNIDFNKIEKIWDILQSSFIQCQGVAMLIDRPKLLEEFQKGYASTKYHGNFKGGLWYHTLLVTAKAVQMSRLFDNCAHTHVFSIITVALLHDIGKLGLIDDSGEIITSYYVTRNDASEIKMEYNKKVLLPHAQLSANAYAAMSAYDLSPLCADVHSAILLHNGAYENGFKYIVAGQESPLMLATHWADMFVARIMEL